MRGEKEVENRYILQRSIDFFTSTSFLFLYFFLNKEINKREVENGMSGQHNMGGSGQR